MYRPRRRRRQSLGAADRRRVPDHAARHRDPDVQAVPGVLSVLAFALDGRADRPGGSVET